MKVFGEIPFLVLSTYVQNHSRTYVDGPNCIVSSCLSLYFIMHRLYGGILGIMMPITNQSKFYRSHIAFIMSSDHACRMID